jgi:gamma-glutamyltranspeptidase/glutathione hydrolase
MGMNKSFRKAVLAICFALTITLALSGIGYSRTPRATDFPRFIPVVSGRNGAVAAPSSAATSVGLKVLMDGGNAIDAAVSAAATATVSEFMASGIGGHGIMVMYWAETGEVKVLDWGGFLPHALTMDQYGTPPTPPPETSVLDTIFPGTLAGWAEALRSYGTISLSDALQPAIKYAEEGIPVNPWIADSVVDYAVDAYKDIFPELADVCLIDGRRPKVGEILKFPDLANTYRQIAEHGPDLFYKGELGDKIVSYLNENGSRFTKEEFETYKPIWRDTLSTTYHDEYEIFVAKNQNFSPVILTMFNIWENFDLRNMGIISPETLHVIIETSKIALADRTAYYGDPDFVDVPYDILTSKDYGRRMAARIDMTKAAPDRPGDLNTGESTTNIAVVDKDHNMVLITQTLGDFFGCMHVVPGTGIILNNEGLFFDFVPVDGPNYPAPGKRVENQMGGVIALKNGKVWAGMGCPGGTQIPLIMAQVLMRMIDHDLRIQDAIEVPRTRYRGNGQVQIEKAVPWETIEQLWRMGHYVTNPSYLCGISGVWVDPETGVMEAGAEPSRNYTRGAY